MITSTHMFVFLSNRFLSQTNKKFRQRTDHSAAATFGEGSSIRHNESRVVFSLFINDRLVLSPNCFRVDVLNVLKENALKCRKAFDLQVGRFHLIMQKALRAQWLGTLAQSNQLNRARVGSVPFASRIKF